MATQQLKTIVQCAECGSTEVEIRAWVSPNDNNSFAYYYDGSTLEETETCYCRECGQWRQVKLGTVPIPPDDPWRCRRCGSLAVEDLVWRNANTEAVTEKADMRKEFYCNDCDTYDWLIRESELLEHIREWLGTAKTRKLERAFGLKRTAFASELFFRDICVKIWEELSIDDKITIWNKSKSKTMFTK